tara:strand:+ start:9288 stop:9587 length:300 start_codon:yes stop_codon:yes gene_type:complete
MKMYNNGQRKAMMYGGAAKRKPMMYGGMSTKKPRKKAQAGGMMMSAPQEPLFKQPMQPAMGMAYGGKAKLGDLDNDGKMSGYETARQNAIEKNMKKKKV